jgi:predicted nucleic-acid-binding Zn-ribbon protein
VERRTQKIDTEPCEKCGATTWECRRVTMQTPYPWKVAPNEWRPGKDTWPWVGGILVTCPNCKQTWYGNASMERFYSIRDQLPMDGSPILVSFKLGRQHATAQPVRQLRRPARRPAALKTF